MFESARVKLTLFYLAILLAFSLTLSASFRLIFEHEYDRSNSAQRSGVRQIFQGGTVGGLYAWPARPYSRFTNLQDDATTQTRQRLNRDFVLINVAALAIGGLLSYWFAGRTLKPIEEAHHAQARFAADASHELRTPLTNLRLENEVFLRQKQFTESDARELIHSNLEEVQRLEGLSANLLALTQYGHTPLKLKSVQVKQVVAGALRVKEQAAAGKQAAFRVEAAPAVVTGHQDSLEEAVAILLDNAIKYGPPKATVVIGGKKEDNHYLLWVQDAGPGIAEADLPHIFERLYRGDKARSSKVGGYGLGLSLANIIVKANNAEIKVQNVPGGGACFILRLPLAKQPK
ncbi:MAG TPA: ATP-binding protein [Candidatus Saccharimonadales bacterium]|nr:ATP-binding protein [Candidatus Saccharimonadales bacterium]